MDSDQRKLFIGGISRATTEKKLHDYFKSYGEVAKTIIKKGRGFGFVIFADPSVADRVAGEKHTIDGRTVEAKKAVPRDELQNMPTSNSGGGRGPATSQTRTKKIFVGDLASTVTEDDLKKYFEQFGSITDVAVMYDPNTQRPRGFGYITFDSEDAVENVIQKSIQKSFHELNDKMVEVKKAFPKELMSVGSGRATSGFGGGGGRGGGNYGSGYSQGGYGGRGDNRYGPSLGGRSGCPNYGAAGDGAAGFGSSGGYGVGMIGGYGSADYGTTPGAGGYDSAAGYGSGGAGSAGHGSMPGGGRSAWGSGGAGYGTGASSTGYGGSGNSSMTGYGNATWGTTESGTGAAVSAGGDGLIWSENHGGGYDTEVDRPSFKK